MEASITIDAYPNPSSDAVNVDLSGFDGQVTVQIFNVLGEEIHSLVTTNELERINVSEYPVGSYLLKASNDKIEVTKTLSIVK